MRTLSPGEGILQRVKNNVCVQWGGKILDVVAVVFELNDAILHFAGLLFSWRQLS